MRRLTKLLAAASLVMATGTWSWIATVQAHEFMRFPT
jgi:hypothetical protein